MTYLAPSSTESKRLRLHRLSGQLRNERSTFDAHWKELGDFILPRRTRFWNEDRNKGDKRTRNIINPAGTLACRTMRSGMMAGITNPARPWRRLTTPDPDLADWGPVKQWLHTINKRMTNLTLRTNFYHATPLVYGDAGTFGTAAIGQFPDGQDLLRYYSFPIGSYWLACDNRNVTDTFMREFQMTVRQIVMQFGDAKASPEKRWLKFSTRVKDAWDRGDYETPINVSHLIYPNFNYDPEALESQYKRYADCYWELGMPTNGQYTDPQDNKFLQELGHDLFPIMAPRWQVTGEDVYGTTCPGMEALPDIKELQALEKKKSKALSKMIDPPLQGPPALRNVKASLLPGDLTLVADESGKGGIRPIHETNLAIKDVLIDIQQKEQRISRAFFEDLFLMLDRMEGIQPRNTAEIAERHEEKLLALGPVLEEMNDSFLDPFTDLQFKAMMDAGMVPDPPEEIAGMDLRVEYISIMAQAQKLVGVSGLERTMAFTGNLIAVFPEVRDKINADNAVDEYADMMGVSVKVINSDEVAAGIRAQRAEQQRKAALAQMVPVAADAAKTLSETDMSSDNALTRLTTRAG